MSLSPHLDPAATSAAHDVISPSIKALPSPTTLAHTPNSSLSTLLTESYREVEALRRELSVVRKRAEKAERLATALQALNSAAAQADSPNGSIPEPATRIIMDFEDRAVRAEMARDEAEARKRMLMDNWEQLDHYLNLVESRAADARAGYQRIVAEGGGQLVLAHIPVPGMTSQSSMSNMAPPVARHHPRGLSGSASQRMQNHTPVFPSLPLPPHPNANPTTGTRRPRTPSVDSYISSQPPTKKSRGDRDDRRGREDRAMFSESPVELRGTENSNHQHPHAQSQNLTQHPYSLDLRDRDYIDPHQREMLQHQQLQARVHRSQPQALHQQILSQQPPRMILPPGEHKSYSRHRRSSPSRSPGRSRSSSHSSASSLSVDEMLLQATTGDERNGTNGNSNGTPPPQAQLSVPNPRRRHHQHRDHDQQRPRSSHSLNSHHTHPHSHQHLAHVDSPQQQLLYLQHQAQHQRHPDSPPYGVTHPLAHPLSQAQSQSHINSAQAAMPFRAKSSSNAGAVTAPTAEPLAQPGQVREYQTHIFAPPVTGAPQKKPKFSSTGGPGMVGTPTSQGPIDTPPPAPPAPAFPAMNEQGQRICRQCGMAGRYKDGKCVEKWGPGPMGPGTVCDRCRKKMKRVERRGTLETQQQLASSNSIASLAALQQQPQPQQQQLQQQQLHHQPSLPHRNSHSQLERPIHRTDTLPAHQSQSQSQSQSQLGSAQLGFSHHTDRIREREREESNIRPPIYPPLPPNSKSGHVRTPPSPLPTIVALHEDDIPTSAIGRGAEAAASRTQSRSNSRNGRQGGARGGGRPTPPVPGAEMNGVFSKKSPLGTGPSGGVAGRGGSRRASISPAHVMEGDGDGDGDVDAEADAEAEAEMEAEIEGAADGKGVRARGSGSGSVEADAEADLLEAVDAAEANSNSPGSGAGGGIKWFKSEDM